MNPEERIAYTERYKRLRDTTPNADYLEWPNCWLAVQAGAKCESPPECNAPMCRFPCVVCSYLPESDPK